MTLVFPYPPISTSTAHALTFLFAFSYVGSLYISKNARLSFTSRPRPTANGAPREKLSQERWRDDPDVIRARLAAVMASTIICCAGVFGMLWHFVGDGPGVGTTFLQHITVLIILLELRDRVKHSCYATWVYSPYGLGFDISAPCHSCAIPWTTLREISW